MTDNNTLDVFLSSDQEEFETERKELSKRISNIPSLNCIPLENRGADSRCTAEASIMAAKKCDIYVGFFGREYSETTIREYDEVVKQRKPCLTYVKKTKRNGQLARFIEEDLKNRFKYHPFRARQDLYRQVEQDLKRLILEILRDGLEARMQSKEEAQRLITEERQISTRRSVIEDPLGEAKTTFENGKYLESLIKTTVTLESALKEKLTKKSVNVKNKALGFLLNSATKAEIVNQSEADQIREVIYVRNAAVHSGEVPDKRTIRWVLESMGSILNKLGAQT